VVDLLTEVGMKLVRTLDPDRWPAPVRDPFAAYCRLSRALRLAMLLDVRLAALAIDGGVALAAERSLSAGAPTDVERAEAQAPRDDAKDRPERDRPDREGPDEIDRFLTRPLTEIAAVICRDLGLSRAETAEALSAFAELTANDDAPDPDSPGAGALRVGRDRRLVRVGGRGVGRVRHDLPP
jgi:hypothetical protein